jgi:hypothetical protein
VGNLVALLRLPRFALGRRPFFPLQTCHRRPHLVKRSAFTRLIRSLRHGRLEVGIVHKLRLGLRRASANRLDRALEKARGGVDFAESLPGPQLKTEIVRSPCWSYRRLPFFVTPKETSRLLARRWRCKLWVNDLRLRQSFLEFINSVPWKLIIGKVECLEGPEILQPVDVG